MVRIVGWLGSLLVPTAVAAAGLADISNRDAIDGLKEALTRGSHAAVARLGVEDAATQYFKRTTSEPLVKRFQPIVKKAMQKVKLAEKYDEIAASGAKLGLVKEEDAQLEDYVTRKALDGLFLIIAEEEKKIRRDPAGAASAMLRKVFGAIGK